MSTGFYLRYDKTPEDRGLRKFDTLSDSHPLVGNTMFCLGCGEDFRAGDVTTLVPIGPGSDEDGHAKCRRGSAFNAVCIPAHWKCVGGEE